MKKYESTHHEATTLYSYLKEKRSKMTPIETFRITKDLNFIQHNQACEGFILTSDDIDNAYNVLTGKRSADDIVADLVAQYKR